MMMIYDQITNATTSHISVCLYYRSRYIAIRILLKMKLISTILIHIVLHSFFSVNGSDICDTYKETAGFC